MFSFVNLFTWDMLLDSRTSMSAWLVVVVFWLYMLVVVVSCLFHWKHIYDRVQMNKIKQETEKKTEGSMIRSMCSIRALERQATAYAEIDCSTIPYTKLKDTKMSKSLPSIQEENKRKFDSARSIDY